jgi:hypothetical protein
MLETRSWAGPALRMNFRMKVPGQMAPRISLPGRSYYCCCQFNVRASLLVVAMQTVS